MTTVVVASPAANGSLGTSVRAPPPLDGAAARKADDEVAEEDHRLLTGRGNFSDDFSYLSLQPIDTPLAKRPDCTILVLDFITLTPILTTVAVNRSATHATR